MGISDRTGLGEGSPFALPSPSKCRLNHDTQCGGPSGQHKAPTALDKGKGRADKHPKTFKLFFRTCAKSPSSVEDVRSTTKDSVLIAITLAHKGRY